MKTGFARGIDHFASFFHRLNAVHRLLYFGIKILNADAHAVEAEPPQMVYGVTADFAWVDFNRIFAGFNQLKVFADHGKYALDLLVVEKSGGTAAEVQLGERVFAAQMGGEQIQFFFQIADVGIGAAFVFSDDFIAAAVIANGVAKRDMNIKRQRLVCRFFALLFQRLDVFVLGKAAVEAVGSGVRGVARAAGRQAGNQFAVEFGLVVYLNGGNANHDVGCGSIELFARMRL